MFELTNENRGKHFVGAGSNNLFEDLPRPDPAVETNCFQKKQTMSLILIILLVMLLLGALPVWPHSSNWGYYPGSGLGLVLGGQYRSLPREAPTPASSRMRGEISSITL
jgi:hypothetical protein